MLIIRNLHKYKGVGTFMYYHSVTNAAQVINNANMAFGWLVKI